MTGLIAFRYPSRLAMELRHLMYFVATVEWKSLGEKRRAESMSRNLQSVRRYRILRLNLE